MRNLGTFAAILLAVFFMLACAEGNHDALDKRLMEIQEADNYTWTRTEFDTELLGDVTITKKTDGETVYRRSEAACVVIEEYRIEEDGTCYSYVRVSDSSWTRGTDRFIEVEAFETIDGLRAEFFDYESRAYVMDASHHAEAFAEDAEKVEEVRIELDDASLTLTVVRTKDDRTTTFEWVFSSIGTTEIVVPDFDEENGGE